VILRALLLRWSLISRQELPLKLSDHAEPDSGFIDSSKSSRCLPLTVRSHLVADWVGSHLKDAEHFLRVETNQPPNQEQRSHTTSSIVLFPALLRTPNARKP
jgi:hypothetical protein